jgi:choice-of-anchor B domain-containing protein
LKQTISFLLAGWYVLEIGFANPINFNIDLVSITEFENANNNYGVSDVWGYTDEAGIEYAIVGHQFGTTILDVSTNPSQPIEIANIPGPSSGDYYYHRDYKTHEHHLYIVNEMYGGDVGMQVVDLSPLPENPPEHHETYNQVTQSHNLWIDNESSLAFIEHHNGDNIHIADLTNPSFPVYGGTFGNQAIDTHDIYTRNGVAYVSEGWQYKFGIYDVSDISNIQELATIPVPGGYAHNAWLSSNGTHLVTTEETVNKTVKIWDISNLNNIELSGEYLGENGLAHNVHVLNDLIYISHYSTGLKIVDIFDPEDPVEVGAYDTYHQGDEDGYVGCWGAFPFTQNDYVYASDMQNGLFVFQFEQAFAGWVDATIELTPGVPFEGAELKSTLNNKTYVTNEQGFIHFGFPEGDQLFVLNNTDTLDINILSHQTIDYFYIVNDELNHGDVNEDSVIDILDIVQVVNFVLQTTTPTPEQMWIADMNEDNILNIQDIILILNVILG